MRVRKICILGMLLWVGVVCKAQSPGTVLFKVQSDKTVSATLAPVLFETSVEFSLKNTSPVYGLSVSGHIVLQHETNSMVRITAECADGIEYLVYEANPLLVDEQEFDIADVAMETAVLQAENVVKLNITLLNAAFTLQNVKYALSAPQSTLQAKQSIQKAQENAIIDRLNESLEKKGMLWRAGNTSISELTYEQKKAIFGDSVPYLGGFEYYRGGIFVMPGYDPQAANKAKSADDDKYVKEWDWRNRHGKNWVTPVKNQGNCGSCWAFSAVAVVETYINLYYNYLYNYDLSEQHLLSCADVGTCGGGSTELALQFLADSGIVSEKCFPYMENKGNCDNNCLDPNEKIQIEKITPLWKIIDKHYEIKPFLFQSPLCFGNAFWHHVMVVVGFTKIEIGDTIRSQSINPMVVREGNSLIGKTAWLLKNSWGEEWGNGGYAYVYVEDFGDITSLLAIQGGIRSLNLNQNDIRITDNDGDGYYVWGIGERPLSLPEGSHLRMDGDDSSPNYGPIDKYGHLELITHPIIIHDVRHWDFDEIFHDTIIVANRGSLCISGNIKIGKKYSVIVEEGGSLTIDGGFIECANILIQDGGNFQILNNGKVSLYENGSVKMESGAIGKIDVGSIRF